MILSIDLRLGNTVHFAGNDWKVDSLEYPNIVKLRHAIHSNCVIEQTDVYVQPIPISDESLKARGFDVFKKKSFGDFYKLTHFGFSKKIWWVPGMYFVVKKYGKYYMHRYGEKGGDRHKHFKLAEVSYIHEIENIYYALENSGIPKKKLGKKWNF